MFSNLATKVALKKVGLPADTFDFSSWKTSSEGKSSTSKKLTKPQPTAATTATSNGNSNNNNKTWPDWMSVKSLPLTVQPWLTPRPPPIPVAEPPRIGDLAPLDRDRKLGGAFGGGRKVLVVFLRCVGCAFAQKTFLHLRALATKYPPSTTGGGLTCIAVSHSSAAATQKWIDMLGGTRGGLVQVIIDEERAVYAAWGLGLGSVWYVLNPASQVAGFREKGWLGERVASSLGDSQREVVGGGRGQSKGEGDGGGEEDGPATTMGNKWQQAGAWAVDGRGKVVWGGRAARADDVLDLDAGVKALGIV